MGKKQSEFAGSLKKWREARGLTQAALAKKADLSARVISDIERSVIQTPQRATRESLANALDLSGSDRDAFLGTVPPRRRETRRTTQLASPPLPVPPTPLVDRKQSAAAVSALLRRAEVRLVTLLGPVGVGKTRLSLAVAAGLQRAFPAGI